MATQTEHSVGKRPSEVRDGNLVIGSFGLAGAVVAVVADLSFKSDASAVKVLGQGIREGLPDVTGRVSPDAPYIWVMLFLIALGVMLCFAFDVRTKYHALFTGASVLAFVMTFVPYELAPPAAMPAPVGSGPDILGPGSTLSSNTRNELLVQQMQSPGPNQVLLTVTAHNPMSELTITLRDRRTAAVVGRSRFVDLSGVEHEFILDTSPTTSEYVIAVDAPGHRTLNCTFSAVANLHITIRLEAAARFLLRGFGNLNLTTQLGECPASLVPRMSSAG